MTAPRLIALGVMILLVSIGGASGVIGSAVGATTDNAVDNETSQHVHPDEVNGDGNLDDVSSWLSGRMGKIHLDCAEGVTIGAYDVCDRLDDEYPEHLKRYGTVERETEDNEDTTETFAESRDTQAAYADDVEEFWEAHDEYREAREAGDETRSRQTARKLLESADDVEQDGDSLTKLFFQLENQTGVDYSDARAGTEKSQEEVLETAAGVESAEFDPTELSTSRNVSNASFTEPVGLSGEVTNETGAPISQGKLVVIVDDRRVATARTDVNGQYETSFRPTVTSTGNTNITVRYAPATGSAYLESEASTTVTVRQVDTEVDLTHVTDALVYDETINVAGVVSVGNRTAPGVRVAGTLGSVPLGNVRTGGDGGFQLSRKVPANVPAGEQSVVIGVSESGLALKPTERRSTVTVGETKTNLSLDAAYADGAIDIQGQLTSVDGQPVEGQSIAISESSVDQSVATTDTEGRFEVTVADIDTDRDEWRIQAIYADSGTNLGDSQAATMVYPPTRDSPPQEAVDTVATVLGVGTATVVSLIADFLLLIGLVGGLLGILYLFRQPAVRARLDRYTVVLLSTLPARVVRYLPQRLRYRDETRATSDDGTDSTPAEAVEASREPSSSRTEQLFAIAEEKLQRGSPSEAVTLGYAGVRDRLQSSGSTDETIAAAQTHREFYREVTEDLSNDQRTALRTVTDAYERAAFASSGVDESTAEEALRAARDCLDIAAESFGD